MLPWPDRTVNIFDSGWLTNQYRETVGVEKQFAMNLPG
jgi:hypothetical protein